MGMFPMPQVKIGHVLRQENKTRGNSPLFQGKKPWPISQRQDVNSGSIQWSPPGAQDCYKDNPMTPNLAGIVLDLRRGGLHFLCGDVLRTLDL